MSESRKTNPVVCHGVPDFEFNGGLPTGSRARGSDRASSEGALRRQGADANTTTAVKANPSGAGADPGHQESLEWMPSPSELLRHMTLYRTLRVAVDALDPAAADNQPYSEWDAAKWAVFNAAVRLVKETAPDIGAGADPGVPQLDELSLTEGELTKRLEGVVVRLMNWCDCGGEGCDLCHSAKAVTSAAISIVTLQRQLAARLEDAFRAGYHCVWEGGRYHFDPAFKPGDPDGAYAAWLATRLVGSPEEPHESRSPDGDGHDRRSSNMTEKASACAHEADRNDADADTVRAGAGSEPADSQPQAEVAPGDGRAKEMQAKTLIELWRQRAALADERMRADPTLAHAQGADMVAALCRQHADELTALTIEAGDGRAARLQALVRHWRAVSSSPQECDIAAAQACITLAECANQLEAAILGGQPEGQ